MVAFAVMITWHKTAPRRCGTYRTAQDAVSLVATLLDVILQCCRIQRLQQLEAAEKLAGDRHDSSPVVKLATILLHAC